MSLPDNTAASSIKHFVLLRGRSVGGPSPLEFTDPEQLNCLISNLFRIYNIIPVLTPVKNNIAVPYDPAIAEAWLRAHIDDLKPQQEVDLTLNALGSQGVILTSKNGKINYEASKQYAENTLKILSTDNCTPQVKNSVTVRTPYTLKYMHDSIKAVIFDLDNTLAATDHLRTFREKGDRAGLVAALKQVPLEVHEDLRRVLGEVSTHVPIALVTLSPRWYAERLAHTLFPGIEWASMVTYVDVERRKPYPDAFRLAAKQMNVPAAEVVVVGDSSVDVEAAYHAGMHVALATWHVEDTNALKLIPDTVLKHPEDLLWYLTSPVLGRPFLEAWLMDEDWEELDYFSPFPTWTDVPGQPPLSVGILGRYFPRYDRTLHLHDAHLLSQQIVAKERPEPFQMPPRWARPLDLVLASHDVDIVTVVPTKPGKDQRLERMLEEVKREEGMTYMPNLLAFDEGTPDVKRLPSAERYPTIRKHLHVQGDCRGKRVLVFDDVLTQGATLQAATDRLLEAGATEVKRLAIARTISSEQFEVSDEARTCPQCGAPLRRYKRGSDGAYFWGCSGFFRKEKGCKYTENAISARATVAGGP